MSYLNSLQNKYPFDILNLFMIKKIDIAGIQLDNYTVREAIMKSEKMLSNNEFNTIEEVGLATLKFAEQDERVKNIITNLDMTVISDVGILRAADKLSMQRQHEIEDRDFLYELLKRIERNHKNVYIIGSSEGGLDKVEGYIKEEFSRIDISGDTIIEPNWNDVESVVNEINSTGVDVIISVLSSPMQELFLTECREMLSANLWYGVSIESFAARKRSLRQWLKHIIEIHKLTLHINNYKEREK